MIGIDTLRADHLGCYGYPRPTSPRIDALARDGVLFTTAVSQAPWTLPAFASIFTGLLPSHHRAGEGSLPYVTSLDGEAPTLAAVLHEHGFATASFVSNIWVGSEVGLDRGFETFALSQHPSEAVDHAIAWLSSHRQSPFFLFVHIFDPHAPYTPSPEHAKLFVSPDYAGPIGNAFPAVWSNGVPDMRVDRHWSAADRQRVVDLYDAEIHYADGLVGRVLDAVGSGAPADDTLVAVVADHGEELFDHQKLGHGHTLYDELLLVPLVLRFPGASPRGRITSQVRTMDLFPTVLDALGVAAPPRLDGESLMPLVHGGRGEPGAGTAFSEFVVHADDPGMKSLRRTGEKLVLSPAAGRRTYFDLTADPREQQNVAPQHAERVASLAAEIEQQLLSPLGGFYLLAVGREEHDLRLRLESRAGFVDVAPLYTEGGDRVRLDPDGHGLELDLELRPHASPVRNHDLDGVRFRTPGDEPVIFAVATLDGNPIPPGTLTLGSAGIARSLTAGATFASDRMLVRYPTQPGRVVDTDFAVNLQLVRPAAPAAATFDADAVERLRALGYVQ